MQEAQYAFDSLRWFDTSEGHVTPRYFAYETVLKSRGLGGASRKDKKLWEKASISRIGNPALICSAFRQRSARGTKSSAHWKPQWAMLIEEGYRPAGQTTYQIRSANEVTHT